MELPSIFIRSVQITERAKTDRRIFPKWLEKRKTLPLPCSSRSLAGIVPTTKTSRGVTSSKEERKSVSEETTCCGKKMRLGVDRRKDRNPMKI